MDKLFSFIKQYPNIIALIPAFIEAFVSLLVFLQQKQPFSVESNDAASPSTNQIVAGNHSTNSINTYDNCGNTTINVYTTNTNPSSSKTVSMSFWDALVLSAILILITTCIYLKNRELVITTISFFAITFYIFTFLASAKTYRLFFSTLFYITATIVCRHFVVKNYFEPHITEEISSQLLQASNLIDKGKILFPNSDVCLYWLIQIGILCFLALPPAYDVINKLKTLFHKTPAKSFSPKIAIIFALCLSLSPIIFSFFIPTW